MCSSVFKTEAGRDKVRTYYNDILRRFPFGQRVVQTALGQTFILTAGLESNPPILLFHGSCSNSAFWFPEMLALSENFSVYAIDIIGEAGNSEEYRPELDTDDFALWVNGVLTGLGLEKAVFIGNSLGGWVALKFAAVYPACVSALILISSAGLMPIRQRFIADADKARKEDGTVPMTPSIIGEQSMPREVLDFINLIIENYNPIQELPVYADEKLQRLDMPLLFIGGREDVIIDVAGSAERLSMLAPQTEIQIVPDCGHVVANSLEYILPFLMKTK